MKEPIGRLASEVRSRGSAPPRILLAALIACGTANSAWPQAVKGTLLGTITDTQGAALSGATVTITEIGTNISRSTVTNPSGHFVFSNQKDGVYRVSAELAGFKTVLRDGVKLDVNTTVRVDLSLPVGNLEESITVVEQKAVLQTDRADTGRLIESKQLTEAPLSFNRNFQGLLVTVPGASRPFRPHSQFFNSQDSLSSQVNGQSRLANNVMLEGIDDNHKTGLLTVLIPSADAIETVSVSTSNYDAEFGRAGGAVSSVTLKSGTNQLKGSAFFFGNGDSTLAKNYFSGTKAPTSYKQFGAALGGPIVKNKFFFFADYQGTRDNLGQVNRHNVAPVDFRNGDFSKATTKIYDPATGNADGTGRQPFPGNVIPANRISPLARKILALLPAPNVAAALGQNNYEFLGVRKKTTEAFDVKLNYQATDRDSLSYRFSFQRPEVFDPGTYGLYGGPSNDGFAGTGTNKTFSTALNWTHTFGSSAILDVRAGMSYYHNVAVAQGEGLDTSTELGIGGANLDDFTSGISRIEINNGYTNPVIGFSPSLPWDRSERTWNVVSTFTKIRGNHTFKAGFDVRHNRDFLLQVQDNGGSRGRFTFNPAQTALPTDTASQNGYANAFASFLLDLPSRVDRDLKVTDPGTRHWEFFTFVHDKWQVTPKLTLDLGLRHEYYTPPIGLVDKGGLSNFDPDTNTLRVAGYGSLPGNLGVKTAKDNFAPRVGVSYRINEQTVVRGGYGMSVIPFPDNQYAYNFPVKQNNQFNAPNSFAPAPGSMATGFPPPITANIPTDGLIPANTSLLRSQQYNVVPLDLSEGKIHAWNVAFQRQLPLNFAIELAYVANRAHGVLARLELNAGLVPGLDNAGRPYFAKFNRTASSTGWTKTDTRYDALQVKLDRRFSNGLLWTNSYTLGRAKDYANDNGGIGTPANRELSYGLSDFDRKHSFVSSFVYELPFFRNTKGAVGSILGGWQVAGIFVAQSGTPVDIRGGSALRAPQNQQRPDLNGSQKVIGDIGPGQPYFDKSVYVASAANTFGTMTRNAGPRGPAYVNLDASLVKRFKVNDRIAAEFRVDAFNATNTPHFANPGRDFGTPTFGQVTGTLGPGDGAAGPRLLRFGARFTF